MLEFSTERQYALQMDAADPLASFRERFHLPLQPDGEPVLYFCGNSLGLQPKQTQDAIDAELQKWARFAVEGHFQEPMPWFSYHEFFSEAIGQVVGALPEEVVVMGSLTSNLHLMMVSFYRPTQTRYKIVIEGGAFPSDQYAVASQAAFHGFDPTDAIIELVPREGEHTLRTEDIVSTLEAHGDEIALVMLGGVNYYTGQVFAMETIAETAHRIGAQVGFDLAHGAGNVPLALHDWNVDFAVWCSYKYLNSGPGGVSCCFVHERHAFSPDLPRFAGWWGNDPKTRFSMPKKFVPQRGAAGWQLSNAPVLPMAALKASLDLFTEATMSELVAKSKKLTSYLHQLIMEIPRKPFAVLTPDAPDERGCQLSLRNPSPDEADQLSTFLRDRGIVCDVRHDVIRVAPVPMYNSFLDVWTLSQALEQFFLAS
jgi:kynureninase